MEKTKRERLLEERIVQCSNGHNTIRFNSILKIPICPTCHKEVTA